jgi:exosortase/archaeosortase family protein
MKLNSVFIKEFLTEDRWKKVRGILWFCLITILIHLSWKIWELKLHYFPIANLMKSLAIIFNTMVFDQSSWVLIHLLKIKLAIFSTTMYCDNGAGVSLVGSCSGIKQIMQFALLMIIFPGTWKKKAWYIPLGMIIVHLTNVLRIICLGVIANNWPDKIQYAHDNWLRIMFYVVIFGLWVLWVEKIDVKKT